MATEKGCRPRPECQGCEFQADGHEMLVRITAMQGRMETIGDDVESHGRKLDKICGAIYGNGRDGLVVQVDRLNVKEAWRTGLERTLTASAIGVCVLGLAGGVIWVIRAMG